MGAQWKARSALEDLHKRREPQRNREPKSRYVPLERIHQRLKAQQNFEVVFDGSVRSISCIYQPRSGTWVATPYGPWSPRPAFDREGNIYFSDLTELGMFQLRAFLAANHKQIKKVY